MVSLDALAKLALYDYEKDKQWRNKMKTNFSNEELKEKGNANAVAQMLKDNSQSDFIEVELLTKDFQKIGKVKVPPMKPLPEVIGWGNRIFVKRVNTNVYCEGIVWYVPDDVQVAEAE